MAETTGISWCDSTFNPWSGCTKVSPGCTNCYAETFAKRTGMATWGPNGTRVKTSDKYWQQPLRWNQQAEKDGVRRRVFCASLADVFESWGGPVLDHIGARLARASNCVCSDRPPSLLPHGDFRWTMLDDLRRDLFALIDATPWLDWLILTKRPENIPRMWCSHFNTDGLPPSRLHRKNVWLGTSVSDQATADRNIPLLLQCRSLSPVLFVSAEPLLGPIDFGVTWYGDCAKGPCSHTAGRSWKNERGGYDSRPMLDWLIVGGESGHHARPCNVEWISSLVSQCRTAGTAVFVKQLGRVPVIEASTAEQYRDGTDHEHEWPSGTRFGNPTKDKSLNGRVAMLKDSKGGDESEWPESLPVREFPEVQA